MYNEFMHYMRNVNAPEGLKRFGALMACSVFLEARSWMKSGPIHRLYPNLFILVVAQPGNGKSLMSNVVLDVIRCYNKAYGDMPEQRVTVAPKDLNPASLIEFLSKPERRKEVYDDGEMTPTTPVLFPATELSILVDNTKFGNMLNNLLEMYEVQPNFLKYTRTNQEEDLKRCAPSMIACTTPSYWFDSLPDNLSRDGFASRCLLYYFNEFIHRPANIAWGSKLELDAIVNAGVKLKNMAGIFRFDDASYKYVTGELNELNNKFLKKHFNGNDLMMGYANRRMDQIKKIAMCLAAGCDFTHTITMAHVNGALAHLKLIEEGMPGLIARKDMRFQNSLGPSIEKLFEGGKKLQFKDIIAKLVATGKVPKITEVQDIVNTLEMAGILFKGEGGYFEKRKDITE
jgi:hypothetical protein